MKVLKLVDTLEETKTKAFEVGEKLKLGAKMSKDIERQVMQHRGWTAEYAQSYQLAALLAGEETDPAQLADFVAYLFTSKDHHKYLTGCILPYGA